MFYTYACASRFCSLMYQKAVIEYTRAIKLMPTSAVYHINRAGASMRVRMPYEAMRDCLHAIALDRTQPMAFTILGLAAYELKEYELAVVAFTREQKLDSNFNHKDLLNDAIHKASQRNQTTNSSEHEHTHSHRHHGDRHITRLFNQCH